MTGPLPSPLKRGADAHHRLSGSTRQTDATIGQRDGALGESERRTAAWATFASRSGFVEITLTFAVLAALELMIPGSRSLAQINPHPFWVPVILFATQYGTGGGLMAAALAIGVDALGGLPVRHSTDDFYSYALKVWSEPALWLCAATLLGELAGRREHQRQTLARQLTTASEQLAAIGRYCEELQRGQQALERAMAVARDKSYGAGVSALLDLHTAPIESLGRRLKTTIELLVGPVKFRIYALADQSLIELRCDEGGQLVPVPASTAPDWALFNNLKKERRVLSAARPGDARLLADTVLAVPIADADAKSIKGMLCIDVIDPMLLTPTTEAALVGLSAELPALIRRHPVTTLKDPVLRPRAQSGNNTGATPA